MSAPARARLSLFDTTLRDGLDLAGLALDDATLGILAEALSGIGLDYIEVAAERVAVLQTVMQGPSAAPSPACADHGSPRLVAFATPGFGRAAPASEYTFARLLDGPAEAISLPVQASSYHVRVALGLTHTENLRALGQCVEAIVISGREALVDCAHFFDGYRADADCALDVARTAYESGARWVVLCDTNGLMAPHEIGEVTAEVAARIPGAHLAIHAHNDGGHAVANTLAAVRAGCRQIHGSLRGLGGAGANADLAALIPTLLLNSDLADTFETAVTAARLVRLPQALRVLDQGLAGAARRGADPSGTARREPTSQVAGRAVPAALHSLPQNTRTQLVPPPQPPLHPADAMAASGEPICAVLTEVERFGLELDRADPRVWRMVDVVKARQAGGYVFAGADASFELLVRRALGDVPRIFSVESFRVTAEPRLGADGVATMVTRAHVGLSVAGVAGVITSVGEGAGPVRALDAALRRDFGPYHAVLRGLEVVDYGVRVMTCDGVARTRVSVTSRDRLTGAMWTTIGVAPSIVDASLEAVVDSLAYKLFRDGITGPDDAAALPPSSGSSSRGVAPGGGVAVAGIEVTASA